MTRIDSKFGLLTRGLGKAGEANEANEVRESAANPSVAELEEEPALDNAPPDLQAQLQARQRAQAGEAPLAQRVQALAAGLERVLESVGIHIDITPDINPGDPAQRSQLSPEDVLQSLKDMGLEVGETLDDPKTKAAIKRFQEAADLEPTGELDMETLFAILESRLNNDRRARSGSGSGGVHGTRRAAGSQGEDVPAQQPRRTKEVDTSNWKAGKGDVTPDQLQKIVPGLSAQRAAEVAPHLNRAMAEAGIDNPQRKAAFVAQLAHESGGFKYMEEIASGKAYEGRRDLGNTQPGDGERFKGRGFIQVTGRANYAAASKALGEDFVKHPERAGTLENAARVAAWYWNSRGLNDKADRGDFDGITKSINGGYNGKADRDRYYSRALDALKDCDGLPSTGQFEDVPGGSASAGTATTAPGKSAQDLGVSVDGNSVAAKLRIVNQFDDPDSGRARVGCGRASITMVINAWREKAGMAPVSQTQMRRPASLAADLNKFLPPGTDVSQQNFNHKSWPAALDRAAAEGKPSVIGVGPPFSPGYGHIMVISKIEGDKVWLMDPNGGKLRETTKQDLLRAAPHSEGSFFITAG